jgi:hypothetical protein
MAEASALTVPEGWQRTHSGTPMPNVVAAVRRSRSDHYVALARRLGAQLVILNGRLLRSPAAKLASIVGPGDIT